MLSSLAVLLPTLQTSFVFRRVLLEIANSIAILICYIYFKNFKRHSIIVVDGYVSIFKAFSEFVCAFFCLCFGLLEVDFSITTLGVTGISAGLLLKALLFYGDKELRVVISCSCGLHILCVLACSFAFHSALLKIGVLPCAARILTCIVPLAALSEFFRVSGPIGKYFAYVADLAAVSVLWWYCSHLSFKYFVLVPSVTGLVFYFIQKVTSTSDSGF